MPVIIEAPDGTEIEFPDGMSDEEMHRSIAEHLTKTQPPLGSRSMWEELKAAPADLVTTLGRTGKMLRGAGQDILNRGISGDNGKWENFTAAAGLPPIDMPPEEQAQIPRDVLGAQMVPMPIDRTIASLPTALRIPAAGAASAIDALPKFAAMTVGAQALAPLAAVNATLPAAAAGAGVFGFGEEGKFSPAHAAFAAALPYIGKYGGIASETLASKAGITKDVALDVINRLGSVGGAGGAMIVQGAAEISQLPEDQKRDAWINLLANAGQALLGLAGSERANLPNRRTIDLNNTSHLTEPLPGGARPKAAPVAPEPPAPVVAPAPASVTPAPEAAKVMTPKERRAAEALAEERIGNQEPDELGVDHNQQAENLAKIKKAHADVRAEMDAAKSTGEKRAAELELLDLEMELRQLAVGRRRASAPSPAESAVSYWEKAQSQVDALAAKQAPIPSNLVADASKLPEGYARVGDNYVYKSESKTAATPVTAPKVEAKETIVSPAVRIGGKTFRGNAHPNAEGEALKLVSDPAVGDALTEITLDPKAKAASQGFIVRGANGVERFVPRAEMDPIYEALTGKKPLKPGGLTSEETRAAGLTPKEHAEALATEAKPAAPEMAYQKYARLKAGEKAGTLTPAEQTEWTALDKKQKASATLTQEPSTSEAAPAQPPGTVRLYRGSESVSDGGVHWTTDPAYAAKQGKQVTFLDVTAEEAAAGSARRAADGNGTKTNFILTPEQAKGAKAASWVKPAEAVEIGQPTPPSTPMETKAKAEAKQPWEMTGLEFSKEYFKNNPSEIDKVMRGVGVSPDTLHRAAIRKAAKEGKAIPEFNRRFTNSVSEKTPASPSDLITRLESMKFKDVGGGVGANPFPEIGKAVWNTGIDVAIGSIKAGRKVGEAVEEAISHLKKNAKGFDEAKVREYLSDLMTKEGDAVPNTASGEVAMRKSAERATTSPMVPKPVQEQIANAPESFYNRQSMRRVEDEVAGMTLDQKLAVPRDSNLYTAARLDAAREYFEVGKNSEGYQVFVELEKEGTRLGQLVNQFKLLKGSRSVDVVRIVNESLKKSGRDALTKEQAAVIEKTAADSKAKDSVLDTATDAWTKDPTDANAKAAESSLDAANKAAVELQRRIGRFQPRGTAQILKSVLQGNLLTPISEVANLVGNASFLPFRAGARGTAALLDIVDSAIRKNPRQVSVQPLAGTVEAAKGAARGIAKVPELLYRGAGDTIKGETRAGLHPVRAWIDQFAKNPERPTTGGKLTLKDRVNMAIEGTFGIPAEVMLRGLGAGDLPFREAARARVIAEQLKLANVPREKWGFAQKFPELFLDRAKMEQVHADTMAAIFQRDSPTLNHVTNWIRGKGDVFDLAVATVAPYKLTPWNIIGEIMSYNPLIALARGTADAVKGNTRAAKLNAGKLVMGSLLTGAGWWLYKNGLLAPSLDERDEAQKARLLSNEVLPPNHINISGLERKLKGGDPAFQSGDKTADVFRAGGLAGAMFYMTANIGRDFERKPETASGDLWSALLTQSTLEQARFGLNQSFLSGVEGLLTAVKDGNADTYLQRYAQTVLAIPMPNTLNNISRVNREYKVDMKADTLKQRVENLIKTRAGVSEYLPLKRGLWGEPLRETPEGRNAIAYQFFDITKGKQVTDDPVSLELYRLWRKTADNGVIPSIPMKELTIENRTYPLSSQQYSRLSELVGQKRKTVADALVVNPNFHKLTDEGKIKILKQAYDVGQNVGRALFLKENLGELQAKPGRSGF